MFEVRDVEDDFNAGLAVFRAGADVADVALRVANDAGDIFQHSKTIVAVDGELNRVGGRGAFIASPLDVDAALRFVHKIGDVGTAYGVHRDSFAASDVADDAFSADGITTAGAVDQHIALAFDHDGVVVAKDAANYVRNGAGLIGESLGLDVSGHGRRGAGGQEPCKNLPRGIFSVADAGHQVIDLAQSVASGNFQQVVVFDFFERDAIFARFFLDQLAADFDGPLALMNVEPVLDLVARAGRPDNAKPVAAGLVPGLSEDFNDVAGVQLVAQRYHASVDFGAHAGVADFGMNGVSEIDWSGIARQHDHFAFRGEGVDLFGIEIDFQRRDEFVGITDMALPCDDLPQPRQALFVLRRIRAVLVFPMGGDSLLGHLVHLFGADLDFKRRSVFRDHRGMQRLVEVGARHGDEILDASRDRPPDVVDDP